jgi:hypothetical protein
MSQRQGAENENVVAPPTRQTEALFSQEPKADS